MNKKVNYFFFLRLLIKKINKKLFVIDCLRGCHAQQLDISQNLNLCDLLQVWNSVFVVQLMDSIDSHLEVMKATEDNDLQENIFKNVIPVYYKLFFMPYSNSINLAFACNKFCKTAWTLNSNLKVASCCERKCGNSSLLRTPTLTEKGVSYKGFLLQSRVKMKSNVTAFGIT